MFTPPAINNDAADKDSKEIFDVLKFEILPINNHPMAIANKERYNLGILKFGVSMLILSTCS